MKKVDDKYFIKPEKDYSEQTIESVLAEDEKILWKDKPRRLSFVLSAILKMAPIAIVWLGFDIFFICVMVSSMGAIPSGLIAFIVIFFAFHLIPVWMWIYSILSASRRQKLEEYAFTNLRIIIKRGFIGSEIKSIYYSSLNSVNLKVGIIEKLCKVGDIYLVANNEKIILEDVKDPYFISKKLQKIALDIKTDIIYPNDLRPKTNHGYKTDYKE